MIFMIIYFNIIKMGIKNLNKFLRDKSNTLFVPIHLSEYAYKKVAIDISLYLNIKQFAVIIG